MEAKTLEEIQAGYINWFGGWKPVATEPEYDIPVCSVRVIYDDLPYVDPFFEVTFRYKPGRRPDIDPISDKQQFLLIHWIYRKTVLIMPVRKKDDEKPQ